MRRYVSPVLVGLGVFLVIGGLLLRFYAYPRLAVAPVDQNSVTKLEASGAEIFDTTTLSPLNTDLTIENRTVGDVAASKAQGDNVLVWVSTTSIRSDDGTVRSRSASRTAFNANSAAAVNCCDGFVESTQGERDPVKRNGLVYKFPFGTDKKTYQVWDDTAGAAVETKYVKETMIDGLAVYQFSSTVGPVKTGTIDVPGNVVGVPDEPTVTGDRMYSATKTAWVEPVTGAIIDQRVEQDSTVAIDGEDKLTTTKADIRYTDAQVKANAEEFKASSSQLSLVKGLLPILGIILGLLAIGAGVLIGRRNPSAA